MHAMLWSSKSITAILRQKQGLTEGDMYDGGVRSKSERWRLGYTSLYDAVHEDDISH